MHFIYDINSHESRFNLVGLINQQCTTYMSDRAQTHVHRVGSQAPYPISPHK